MQIYKKAFAGQKMKLYKTIFAIAIITFMMTSSIFLTLGAKATEWPAIATGAYISVAPKVIGVGQQLVVNIIIEPSPQLPRGSLGNIVASNVGYANVSVTFIKPDGTKDTFMPRGQNFISGHLDNIGAGWTESVGALYFYYTPKEVGNWSVTCSFPGQTYTELTNTDTIYYKPSTSPPFYFTVQTEPVNAGIINGYPYSPLPTEYWTNPVNINNREWSAISGDWLMAGYNNAATRYNPYSTGPTTSHILWNKQQVLGGLMGGDWGSEAYFGGQTAIIMNGKVYYNSPYGNTFVCVDLTTGKELYKANGTINRGIHLLPSYQVAAQQDEGIPEGWLVNTGTWQFYDPFTGALAKTFTNIPSGIGSPWWDDGSNLVYFKQSNYLLTWDISKVTNNNWMTGMVSNFSIVQPGANLWPDKSYSLLVYPGKNVFLLHQGNGGRSFTGYDMTTGAWLYTTNLTYLNVQQMGGIGSNGPSGPFIHFDGVTSSLVAYDVRTGAEIWKAPIGEYPWGAIPSYYYITIGDVKYSPRFDGYVYAVSLTNGSLLWKSPSVGETGETVENTWIFGGSSYANNGSPYAGADGKLYVSTQTNYRGEPMTRFNKLFCINATTGQFIWNVTGAIAPTAIANGYLLGNNGDNGILYCFGKGPTSTTVQTALTNQLLGNEVLITGNVLDQSPAQPGTPAVSDASMTTQMNYYMQNDATLVNNPPTPTGVPVTLTAFDPNHNTQIIGQTTTDSAGLFAISWTPPVPGIYTIIATFEGTNAYWRSSAETAVNIVPAATAPAPSSAPASVADMYFIPAIAGLFALIIVVAIVLAILMLRKRP